MKDSVVYSTITCLPVSWGTVSSPAKEKERIPTHRHPISIFLYA